MTDRIWIKGRSAWHATTIKAIDTARAEDRMVAVTCDKLIDARDTVTISTERPEAGCCGGCMVRIESSQSGSDTAKTFRALISAARRHPDYWHKTAEPIDVIHSRNSGLLA